MTLRKKKLSKITPLKPNIVADLLQKEVQDKLHADHCRQNAKLNTIEAKLKLLYPMSKTVVKEKYKDWLLKYEFCSMITLTLPDGSARNQLALEKKLRILAKRLNKKFFGQQAAAKYPDNTVSFIAVFEEHATGGLHIHTLFQLPRRTEFCKLKLSPDKLESTVHSLWNKITGAQQIDEKSIDDAATNRAKIEYCLKRTYGRDDRVYFDSFAQH